MVRSGGKRMVTVVPCPGRLAIVTLPPWSSDRDFARDSPSPGAENSVY